MSRFTRKVEKDLPFRLITLSRVGGKSGSFTLDIINIGEINMMFMSVAMVILCIVLGGFMIRSCMGKTNSSSEAKQAISDVRKIIDKKELIKYKRRNQR